jgi:hypothetical protein
MWLHLEQHFCRSRGLRESCTGNVRIREQTAAMICRDASGCFAK